MAVHILNVFSTFFILYASQLEAAKILVIPANVNSHVLFMAQISVALADQGDKVTLLLPSNTRIPDVINNSTVEVIQYKTERETSAANSPESSKLMIDIALAKSFSEWSAAVQKWETMLYEQFEVDFIHRMNDKSYPRIKAAGYDMALVDGADIYCGFAYPYSLDLPYAAVSVGYLQISAFRLPTLPSFSPSYITTFSDSMTFSQRLINTFMFFMEASMMETSTEFIQKHVPDKPALTGVELFSRSVLWFILEDIAFNYPSPYMPNVIPMADVMAREGKNLPQDLQTFLEGAQDGVLLVSLGSYLDFVPVAIVHKLCEAFKKIPLQVIWKLGDKSLCQSDALKIKAMKWIPQNDLLGHTKVKLFITHGGLNSVIESIHHAKPMIVLPIAIDQPFNAAIIKNRNFGTFLNIANFTAEELAENIMNVYEDNEIIKQLQRASKIISHKPQGPGQRASFWINHVTKYGGSHLRSGAFKLSVFEFIMFDVFLFLVLLFVVLVFLLIMICYCCVHIIKRSCWKFLKQDAKEKML